MKMSDSANPASGPSAPRVLLECENPTIQDGLERVLHENGFVVSVCAGPSSRSSGCALLEHGRCGLVDDAQIVVHALDPTDPSNREVLATLMQGHAHASIVVEADLVTGDEPGNVRRVRFPMSRGALLDAVRHAAVEVRADHRGSTSAP